MKKEKKVLLKKFKAVIEDLLDNYESYTEEEQLKIKEIFQKVAELNKDLDKYDDNREDFWVEYLAVYGQFFGPFGL